MSSTKMASSKRKQDEKHLKMLREMAALPHNKQCFDCHQRGPTYVNMTAGSFVCTSCSGILRGINPPHRVKSISMTSFTPDEMEFLKCHGNDLCRKVYLGLYDSRSCPEPDAREEQKVKDFMVQKYERKRFYVAPTEAMKEEARHMNEAAMNKQPQTKPLKSLLGNNTTPLVVQNQAQPAKPQTTPGPITVPTPTQPTPTPKQDLSFQSPGQQSQSSQSSGSTTMDLLGDLGGDPFASSAPPPAPSSGGGGFADFSNFNSQFTAPAQTSLPFQSSGNTLFPMGSSAQDKPPTTANGVFSTPQSTPASTPASSAAQQGGDKYASLADLFSSDPVATTQPSPSVGWTGGSGDNGSALNWGSGGGGSWDGSGVKNTPAPAQTPTTAVSWNSQPNAAANTGFNWNTSSTTNATSSNAFPNAGANPFGGGSTTVPAQPAMGPASNPFGGAGSQSLFGGQTQPTQAGFGQPAMAPGFGQQPPATSMGGFAQPQTSAAGGFGQFGAVPPSSGMGGAPQQQGGTNFGQFGMQNGGGNVAPAAGGFGAFSQPQTMSNFGNAMPPGHFDNKMAGMSIQQQGFGPAAGGAGWGQPAPTANPFMSAASQPVAPSSSSNPFL
ncbi:arf-GAP domain and FG repeat-containing protein 1-like isoform X2 [Mizuhopecten yessoensis]|uniref:arf-GAP domain and FG repeat-containing protein 1-like isoform X2 n=1 Tax=Mizuhopecten yessoensis TaxID=6573 RepID=UPI000B45893C|nr:arf-GAP domain and FG repeat-containing protein 1-like isoform X2 [Mizuhopecten yessoensis]